MITQFRRFCLTMLLGLLILSCQSSLQINSNEPGAVMVEIKETTVGYLNEVQVGVGNIWEREYSLPDSTVTTGLTAQLFIGEGWLFVGVGSVFDVDGETWEVIAVEKQGKLGLVKLKQVNSNEQ